MLWVVAFFVTIAAVMIGIRRWKTANDPLYALDERNRKVWERESGEELVYEYDEDDWVTDPAYTGLLGNIYTHRHDD